MDKLLNEFTVNRPIDETWNVLTDVERIAPCMPGATLEEIEGDVFRGVVKVKLGAISTAFKGQANFVERDDTQPPCRAEGEGRDTTGKGNASADDHRAARIDRSDDTTKCCRRDRPAHHRQGRPVRPRHHGRRQQEADEPVRDQPQHDARSAAGGRGRTPVADEAAAERQCGRRRSLRPERQDRASATRHRRRRQPVRDSRDSGVRKINGPAAAPDRVVRRRRIGDPQARAAADRWPRAAVDRLPSSHAVR